MSSLDIQKLVESRQGTFYALKGRVLIPTDPVRVTCAQKHAWNTTVRVLEAGAWCFKCDRLGELKALAESRNGQCLANEYQGTQFRYRWKCQVGHEFLLSHLSAKKGAWCPVCKREIEQLGMLKRAQEIGRKKGGACLSSAFVSLDKSLHWRCGKGHEWLARLNNVASRTWCPECALEGMRDSIDEFCKIAEDRGGRCISTSYTNGHGKLRFVCEFGHEWEAAAMAIKRGTWCAACSGNRKKELEDARAIAKERGGDCLSTTYQGSAKKLLWQCAKGHQWRTSYSIIAGGSWCPLCVRGSHTFAEIEEKVRAKGGMLLSESASYSNGDSVLKARCREGHGFEIRASAVAQGSWCRQCAANRRRVPLEKFIEYAEARGGRVLSEKVASQKGKNWIYFQCSKGHSWRADGTNLLSKGAWCRRCSYDSCKYSIEDMRKIARDHGGECLSREYINLQAPLQWKCEAGHVWQMRPRAALEGYWCNPCSGKMANSIASLQVFASKRGGRVLSRKYLGSGVKHEFICKEGHRWWTLPGSIRKGSWCPTCANQKPGSIEEMQQLARDRGGACLSTEYLNTRTKLLWRCDSGHQFWAKPMHIKSKKSWCPKCCGRVRRSIEEIRSLAATRGGRLISEEYSGTATPIELECEVGHRWATKAANFLRGRWCPHCATTRRQETQFGSSQGIALSSERAEIHGFFGQLPKTNISANQPDT